MKLALRAVCIGLTLIFLLIPLAMTRGLIADRMRFRDVARQDITESWTGPQTLIGPTLSIPCEREDPSLACESPDQFIAPERLRIEADVAPDVRRRGIYEVPVYTSKMTLSGTFTVPAVINVGEPIGIFDRSRARLVVSLSDIRGLGSQPAVVWNGEPGTIHSGVGLTARGDGFHVPIDLTGLEAGAEIPFSIHITLRGSDAFRVAAQGQETEVLMSGAWSDPGFVGDFLPVERSSEEAGFTAHWRVAGISSGQQMQFQGSCQRWVDQAKTFGLTLVTPVDIYQQADRSVKYGHMVILLTFAGFGLLEITRKRLLHPIQYALIGGALALFFVLLIALSEHVPFWIAYVVAAGACTGLIGVYVAGAVQSVMDATGITGLLTALYGALFGILRSEQNALLMGSTVLFLMLAAIMLTTRRIDWFQVGRSGDLSAPSPAPPSASP